MPIMRTYACPDCEGQFEFLHLTRDEPPPEVCELCGEFMGEEPAPLPARINLGSEASTVIDNIAQDAMAQGKMTDMKTDSHQGEVTGMRIHNPVTDYMDAMKSHGFDEWGTPAGMLGKPVGPESAGRQTLGTIQQNRLNR